MDLNDLMKNPEQIKNLINVLQALLPKEDNTEVKADDTQQDDDQNYQQFNIKTKNKHAIPSGKNKFDSMAERNMHKDDTVIDQKLNQAPPTARHRHFAPINVVCRVCGKKESVSPSLVYESPSRYKCNNCATSAG